MADTERVVELITMIAGDPSLRDRLAAASEEDRPGMLAELGFPDLTPADVAAHAASFVPRVVDELSDGDLEDVAGGAETITTVTIAGTTGFVVIAGGAAAAAT